MVAVSYAACECQYGLGDVTELNGCVWDAKCWPLRIVFGVLSFPEITLELVPKPATSFRLMLNRDTFSYKHNVKMETLVTEIYFGRKEDTLTKNLQES